MALAHVGVHERDSAAAAGPAEGQDEDGVEL